MKSYIVGLSMGYYKMIRNRKQIILYKVYLARSLIAKFMFFNYGHYQFLSRKHDVGFPNECINQGVQATKVSNWCRLVVCRYTWRTKQLSNINKVPDQNKLLTR